VLDDAFFKNKSILFKSYWSFKNVEIIVISKQYNVIECFIQNYEKNSLSCSAIYNQLFILKWVFLNFRIQI